MRSSNTLPDGSTRIKRVETVRMSIHMTNEDDRPCQQSDINQGLADRLPGWDEPLHLRHAALMTALTAEPDPQLSCSPTSSTPAGEIG